VRRSAELRSRLPLEPPLPRRRRRRERQRRPQRRPLPFLLFLSRPPRFLRAAAGGDPERLRGVGHRGHGGALGGGQGGTPGGCRCRRGPFSASALPGEAAAAAAAALASQQARAQPGRELLLHSPLRSRGAPGLLLLRRGGLLREPGRGRRGPGGGGGGAARRGPPALRRRVARPAGAGAVALCRRQRPLARALVPRDQLQRRRRRRQRRLVLGAARRDGPDERRVCRDGALEVTNALHRRGAGGEKLSLSPRVFSKNIQHSPKQAGALICVIRNRPSPEQLAEAARARRIHQRGDGTETDETNNENYFGGAGGGASSGDDRRRRRGPSSRRGGPPLSVALVPLPVKSLADARAEAAAKEKAPPPSGGQGRPDSAFRGERPPPPPSGAAAASSSLSSAPLELCPVCLEADVSPSEAVVFPCGHATCRSCHAALLGGPQDPAFCPLCRAPLKGELRRRRRREGAAEEEEEEEAEAGEEEAEEEEQGRRQGARGTEETPRQRQRQERRERRSGAVSAAPAAAAAAAAAPAVPPEPAARSAAEEGRV